jgi:hypothetical protein
MSTWNSRRTALRVGVASMFLCTACATTTNGAWYHQSDDGTDSLYFAFIYKGPKENLVGAKINSSGVNGWDCGTERAQRIQGAERESTLFPGQLVVMWLPQSKSSACEIVVPLDATLRLRDSKKKERQVTVHVSTLLPSALPESWLICPDTEEEKESKTDSRTSNPESANPSAREQMARLEQEAAENQEALVARQEQRNGNNARISALNCDPRAIRQADVVANLRTRPPASSEE